MTGPIGQGARRRGALLLADISGYTGFLQGVAEAHLEVVEADEPPAAYAIVSSLLDAMVEVLAPAFALAKFEGDAIFAVGADAVETPHGAAVLACLRACYAAFTARLAQARAEWTCTCNACARIGELDLKFVLHHGEYIAQRIAGREELLGTDVNVVHRLLKNHAREAVGARPYALLTDDAVRALDVPADGMTAMTESYDNLPAIQVHVVDLGV